ncbi:MAG: PEP motif anchor domain-containing protein [bacterium]|nr:MAG: PEP motif anchor domain-containing protein [bacterium]KAF0148092.1 MAG: PEP motif anchor domain-containing protein [bacterium]KAF0167642.1 MAG: PEP motif anchor domain-containing protein [bacterium]TXT19448.1 MAG: PEP motif anchor domain-containing protein [bacterium]
MPRRKHCSLWIQADHFDYLKSGNSGYSCVGSSGGCIELGGSYTSPPSKVDFTLNLAAGNYAISFDYNRQVYGPSGFDLQINGAPVESFAVLAADNIWRTHTEAFTTLGGPVTFSFVTGNLAPNVGTLIDNVTVVPEPVTYALMLAGLGLVGYMARRRKQSAG